MQRDTHYIKTVFGLKLRELRQDKKWSLQDLSRHTGLSKSYLNEIEKGKKYPKPEKINLLSQALQVDFDDLVSTKLGKNLQDILEITQSAFFREIPLELFGISRSSLVSILSDAPTKVSAFIHALISISRHHNLSQEQFYFAVLGSYQELHGNYFPDLEQYAKEFVQEHPQCGTGPLQEEALLEVLEKKFALRVETKELTRYGASPKLRSLYVPEVRELMLSHLLDKSQRLFILAKEVGFQLMGLKERPTTYSWLDFKNFEELLNNHRASYFAGAVLIDKKRLSFKIKELLDSPQFSPKDLETLMREFSTSPETFYYRLTNILPHELGLKDLFYLCFTKKKDSEVIEIIKELHMSRPQAPHRNHIQEHYCRRWIAVDNLLRLEEQSTLSGAQISHYRDSGQSYLVFSTSERNPFSEGTNRSYCLGLHLNSQSIKKLRIARSENLLERSVGVTCQSCGILDCKVRQAPPVRLEKQHQRERMLQAIDTLRREALS